MNQGMNDTTFGTHVSNGLYSSFVFEKEVVG